MGKRSGCQLPSETERYGDIAPVIATPPSTETFTSLPEHAPWRRRAIRSCTVLGVRPTAAGILDTLRSEGDRLALELRLQFSFEWRYIGNVSEGELVRYPAWHSLGLPD